MAITSKIIVFLVMTTHVVKSGYSPSCTDCAPFIPGAVAYWPMTSETEASDLSGNDNHATFVGLTYTDGLTGEENGAVHFSGSSNSFASVKNSVSMNVGKYSGFSFSGFVRLNRNFKPASLIDWSSNKGFGVFITATPVIQLHLYPNHDVVKHKAEFPNHKLTNGSWHFIGLSYEKATGRATMFNDGKTEVHQIDKNIVAGTDKTNEVGLGIDLSDVEFNFHGDMSCIMLFKFALTTDDFNRVREFCRTTNSAHTILPDITVTDKGTTSATVSWTKSPGIFSGYNIAIERKHAELGMESVQPQFISSSDAILKSVLTRLIPGATYRVHVWHMQGDIKGRARSSEWFHTKSSQVVESDSIIFSEITATSATVTWKEVTGDYDGYSVDISPTMGGAKADPSTVPRGTTTTSLKNLSSGRYYTIKIRTKIGSRMTYPSTRSLYTLEPSVVVESDSIIFYEITATSAKVSWKDVTGNNDGYTVDISPTTGGAKVEPSTVPRGTTTTSLLDLTAGISYIVRIRTKIGSRTSLPSTNIFHSLEPSVVVESDSISFSEITATSAKVSWKDVTGNYDGYSVDISPTTGGAKADPSTVPRGTTTTSLRNLAAGKSYIVQIRTKIGSRTSLPSLNVFHSLGVPTTLDIKTLINIIIAVVLVIVVVIIAVVVILFCRRNILRSSNGKNKQDSIEMIPLTGTKMEATTKDPSHAIKNNLKKRYQRDYRSILFLPYRQDRVLDINKLSRNFEKRTIRGYEEVALEDIIKIEVDGNHKSNRYVLEALPGYGKSSLMKRLVYTWATDNEFLKHLELVFLFNTDDFIEFQNKAENPTGNYLGDFVSSDYFFSDQSIESAGHNRDEIWRLVEANEEHVLFIIDTNYKSELPYDLKKLFFRKTMQDSTVILTCRTNQVPTMIRDQAHMFTFIRIAKHDPANIKWHINDYSDSQGKKDMGNVLVQKLRIENMNNQEIQDDVKLSWITTPFMLVIIINVWQDIWEKGTEDEKESFCLDKPYIYQKVVKHIFKYYECCKGGMLTRVNHAVEGNTYAQETLTLGRLAWRLIEKNKSLISAKKLGPLKDDDGEANVLRNIGVLRPIMIAEDGITKEKYKFTNKIWKFYFAARFLRNEMDHEEMKDKDIQNAVEMVKNHNKNIEGLFKKFIEMPM